MKRLTSLKAVELFAVHRGETLHRAGIKIRYTHLMRRGFILCTGPATFHLTPEGRSALERYLGSRL